jgi:hypothetical protein
MRLPWSGSPGLHRVYPAPQAGGLLSSPNPSDVTPVIAPAQAEPPRGNRITSRICPQAVPHARAEGAPCAPETAAAVPHRQSPPPGERITRIERAFPDRRSGTLAGCVISAYGDGASGPDRSTIRSSPASARGSMGYASPAPPRTWRKRGRSDCSLDRTGDLPGFNGTLVPSELSSHSSEQEESDLRHRIPGAALCHFTMFRSAGFSRLFKGASLLLMERRPHGSAA